MTYQQAVIVIARFVQAVEWGVFGYLGAVALLLAYAGLSRLAYWRRARKNTHVVRTSMGKVRVRNREGQS